MKKTDLIKQIKTDRRQLERYLFYFEKGSNGEFVPSSRRKFSKTEMEQPGVFEKWSLKDLLAHLSGWETLFIDWHHDKFSEDSPREEALWTIPDNFSERIFKDNNERTIEEVLVDFNNGHRDLLTVVESISEDDLSIEVPCSGSASQALDGIISAVTWEHYRWAKKLIRRWSRTRPGKRRNKERIMESIATERRRLESNLASLTDDEMTMPGVIGEWSIKDILAHLVDWEQRFLGWYQAGLRGEVPATPAPGLTWGDLDKLNQMIHNDHKNQPLHEVKSEFHTSYQQVLQTVREIPEDDIFSVGRFAWTGKSNLAAYILANTTNHYRWAKTSIRKWRRKNPVS